MEELKILMALLPIIFMIHDFEEIIMFKPWLKSNRGELKSRFSEFEKFLTEMDIFGLSTSAFAVAVLHEFILLALVTVLSLWYSVYNLWFAAFSAYTVHLFVHIIQWMIYRKYVPFIITTILTLPYCIYTFGVFIHHIKISPTQMLLWTLIGIIAAILSFPSAFYFALKFENWKNKFKTYEK